MAHILVVDDSPLDRRLTARMLEEIGLHVRTAENGRQALQLMEEKLPDLVLTDLQMPELDGLQLVKHISTEHPAVAVILMTAFGSEEVAVEALHCGAASYVPKQNLTRDLIETVKNVLAVARARRDTRTMLDSITRLETNYVLSNTLEGIDALLGHVKDQLKQMKLFGDTDILRIGTALYEALVNAIEHGNLELSSEDREDKGPQFRRTFERRGQLAPYRNRHVYLDVSLTRADATFKVRDQGPGFDPQNLPDPTAPENVGRINGRGLFLIQTFMDEVRFNQQGNELTMVKRRN